MNNSSVESYLAEGCGRCDRFQTADCKVHRWGLVLIGLRKIALASGLVETMKWGSPCYTIEGKNVLMIAAFNEFCALSFFKGALIEDETGALELPGPNSHSGRLLKFRSVEDLEARRELAGSLIQRAVAVERLGKELPKRPADAMPEELQARLDEDLALAQAFDQLTPGRQRSHIIYVSGAKQSKTRASRAEQCAAKVLAGKGFNER